ncbi:MAG TPA: adenylate/guanylate cyclase domain-containing protein [Kofleriaceae bacterium]|nr:adenylate/guanylate cyclase domain-containing protein [Kofleriaceae bacterium]
MLRLRTVRAKLVALASISVVVTLIMLVVLGWLMRTQLIDEAASRVRSARKAYVADLDDRVTILNLAATLLADNQDVQRAIRDGDETAGSAEAADFLKLYPDSDIVLLRKDGTAVAKVGCDRETIAQLHIVADAWAGMAGDGLSGRGCGNTRAPTYLAARPTDAGAVIVGFRFTPERLANTGKKAGIELALVNSKGELIHATPGFPKGAEKITLDERKMMDVGDKTFIVDAFTDDRLVTGKGNAYRLVAARDISRLKAKLYKNLAIALAIVLVAGLIAIAWGVRTARVMSGALGRVSGALLRLKQQEYVKVHGVRTGDELEDLATGFNEMVDGLAERDKLKTTFGKYMTDAVVDHLMAGKVQLGGEALTATILFSDIRSFTTLSEKMDAKQLVALLNEYFTEMVDVVMREDGVVDKYIGDAIMAVFGAPVPKPESAVSAVRAAVGMREALADLNKKLVARGAKRIETGIGVHTGEVVAGNIGSERRMEYTVIGDSVNLASRLESATKELGVAVLISQDTYDLVKDHFDVRQVKEITVKGREQPVMTYEVLGIKS